MCSREREKIREEQRHREAERLLVSEEIAGSRLDFYEQKMSCGTHFLSLFLSLLLSLASTRDFGIFPSIRLERRRSGLRVRESEGERGKRISVPFCCTFRSLPLPSCLYL